MSPALVERGIRMVTGQDLLQISFFTSNKNTLSWLQLNYRSIFRLQSERGLIYSRIANILIPFHFSHWEIIENLTAQS